MSLSTQYWSIFVLCSIVCAAVQFYASQSRSSGKTSKPFTDSQNPQLFSLQNSYLLVFLLVSFADWIQGPYLYQLLIWYGFNQTDIAVLFVMSFASSIVTGLLIGTVADRLGRRFMCVMFCLLSIVATLTNFWPYYSVLMVGRSLSGIASGMFFTLFETWLGSEFGRKGSDTSALGELLVNASFVSCIAGILAGLAANSGAANFGFAAPFGLAMFPLILAVFLIRCTWDENYASAPLSGYSNTTSSGSSWSVITALGKVFPLLLSDASLASLAGAQAFYEGGLYLFLFLWTPSLYTAAEMKAEQTSDTLPESSAHFLGLIFSTMMVCVLVGTGVARGVHSTNRKSLTRLPLYVHLIACFSMVSAANVSESKTLLYGAYLLFLVSVGLFYPTYGAIKCEKIPEEVRSAVINMARLPVLLLLAVLLLHSERLSTQFLFIICAFTHALGFACYFYHYSSSSGASIVPSNAGSSDVSVISEERLSWIPKLDTRSLVSVDRRIVSSSV